MSRWTLDALDPATGELVDMPLVEGPIQVTLMPVPGADAVFTRLRCDGAIRLCAELPLAAGDRVDLAIEGSAEPTWSRPGGNLLCLPPSAPNPPAARRLTGPLPLDLALIIDATWLQADPAEPGGRLLAKAEAWSAVAENLNALVGALAAAGDLRLTVLAFGDERPPFPVAADLQPAFLVTPGLGHRIFERFAAARLDQRLRKLEASPGGDLVDAVADALQEARDLPWHPDHRRLVLLAGDSPGYSITHPAPAGATAFCRALDVESVALELAIRGIEVATLFAPPPAAALPPLARTCHHYTRDQYRRLASLAEWAFEPDVGFDPHVAARSLLARPEFLARGSNFGFLVAAGHSQNQLGEP